MVIVVSNCGNRHGKRLVSVVYGDGDLVMLADVAMVLSSPHAQ